jgi:hypothetical protein
MAVRHGASADVARLAVVAVGCVSTVLLSRAGGRSRPCPVFAHRTGAALRSTPAVCRTSDVGNSWITLGNASTGP